MAKLTHGNVRITLFKMAFPMLAGTFTMNAYNLADTWFVARLGTLPLAAMGFTLPAVMLFTFIAGGTGSGITTLTSHALGRQNRQDAAELVTHGIVLTLLIACLMAVVGYSSIKSVFPIMGAKGHTLELVGDYMRTWYLGAVSMAFPMMGNGILISLGDSRAAGRFMLLGPALNVILDPILIFGYMGIPALGIFGASLATVLSQAVSTLCLFYLLSVKHRLLSFKNIWNGNCIESWKKIMCFAVPAIISMMLMPISSAVITGILSGFGTEAVAACGAAVRIEMFAFVIPMALGISLTPFISQNFGAGRIDRIVEAKKIAFIFAIAYGGLVACLFYAIAPLLAGIFTDDPAVASVLIGYVRVVSFGYGMMEVHRYCGFILTGLQKPLLSTVLNGIRILLLLLPLSFLGAHYWGITGVFAGRLITDLSVGVIGIIFISVVLKRVPVTKS